MKFSGWSDQRAKFDFQLGNSLEHHEPRLRRILEGTKIELKTETWQWEQTGNLCVEYWRNGKASGIAITEADFWMHELRRDGRTVIYFMFPLDQLKDLARRAYRNGWHRDRAGDGGTSKVILIPLRWLVGLATIP